MIIDLRLSATDLDLQGDLCIIGAGVAGLTLARRFLGTRTRVVVLESGGLHYDEAAQDFNDGASTGMRYYDLRNARVRFVGGTINIWGGRCAPLDATDFERRSWVPHSGWPIDRATLWPYYRSAHDIMGLGAFSYDEAVWDALRLAAPPLDPDIVRTDFWHLSPEAGFRQARAADVMAAPNVTLVLHATALRLRANRYANSVGSVEFADVEGRRGTIGASTFVVASGGVENARLLLASNDVEPTGIGNAHDQVGRYFMEHPHARAAEVLAHDPARIWAWYRRRVLPDGMPVAPSLRPAEGYAERMGILNTSMALKYQRWPRHGLPASKVMHLWMKENKEPDRLGLAMLRAFKKVDQWADRYLAGMARPLALKLKRGGLFLIARAEQCPNPDSRVVLSHTERDALGMPRVELSWQLVDLDKRSVATFARVIGTELERLGLGTVRLADWLEARGLDWPYDRTVSNNPIGGFHHMGTTRMATDPRHGVVDADCRVHGYGNLYVAGSSVFSTAGWANPTLTIMALALRLADHLMAKPS